MFLDAVNGNPRRYLFEEFGTSFSLGGALEVPNPSASRGNPVDLGISSAGTTFQLSLLNDLITYPEAGIVSASPSEIVAEFISGTGQMLPGEQWFEFRLTGVTNSVTNIECAAHTRVACGMGNFTVPLMPLVTLEPATLVLVGTGLLGLFAIARQRQTA